MAEQIKKKNWFRRHWVISTILGLIILFSLIGIFNDSSDTNETNLETTNREANTQNSEITEQAKINYFDLIQVTDNKAIQSDPDVYDNVVVWIDERNGNKDIFMKDLSTNEEKQVTSGEEDEFSPLIYQDKIFYIKSNGKLETEKVKEDSYHGFELNDIFLFDITTGETKQITCDGLDKEINDFYNGILLFTSKEFSGRKYLIEIENTPECDQEQEVVWEDYPNEGETTELPFKYLPGRSREGYPSQSSSPKIIGAEKFPKKFLICDDYQGIVDDGYSCSSQDFEKISDRYIFTPANTQAQSDKVCHLLNYAELNLFDEDISYYVEKISDVRKDVEYPCTTITENNLIYFKWTDTYKGSGYSDGVNLEIYSLDVTKNNAFYEEVTNPEMLNKIQDIQVREWIKCYNWKNKGGIYEDCEESQKILSIYWLQTNKVYEIKGNRYQYGGGWTDSWKKLVEEGDTEELPKLDQVKISQNKIVWADKRNEKCIDEIGCDGNTDIYLLEIKSE